LERTVALLRCLLLDDMGLPLPREGVLVFSPVGLLSHVCEKAVVRGRGAKMTDCDAGFSFLSLFLMEQGADEKGAGVSPVEFFLPCPALPWTRWYVLRRDMCRRIFLALFLSLPLSGSGSVVAPLSGILLFAGFRSLFCASLKRVALGAQGNFSAQLAGQ